MGLLLTRRGTHEEAVNLAAELRVLCRESADDAGEHGSKVRACGRGRRSKWWRGRDGIVGGLTGWAEAVGGEGARRVGGVEVCWGRSHR